MERDCSNCLYREDCKIILELGINCGLEYYEIDVDHYYSDEGVINSG